MPDRTHVRMGRRARGGGRDRCHAACALRGAARIALVAVMALGGSAAGSAAQPIEAVTFDEAVSRALAANPSVRQAAADIVRAEALLQQARALSLPSLNATLATTVIGPVPEFAGESIVPRTQLNTGAAFAVPVLTPVQWAQRNQAADQVAVAQRSSAEARRRVAVATAEAYLTIIALRQVVDLNERARENAQAHFDYAQQRFEGGLGSRLNALRARQELSSDEARVEEARLAVRRAQEALGVLVAAPGPVDAAAEPVLDVPPDATGGGAEALSVAAAELGARTDVQLLASRIVAQERVVRDSRREYWPSLTSVFAPQWLAPSGLFSPSRSWSVSVLATVPIWEAGERAGRTRERRAVLDALVAEREDSDRQATSEVRTAREAVRSTERSLASAQAAAREADEVVTITDAAFRAGASTNIEVIDAQRRARDAETGAAIAQNAVRRARLELLVSTGRFPR